MFPKNFVLVLVNILSIPTLGSHTGKFSLCSVGICFNNTGCGQALKREKKKKNYTCYFEKQLKSCLVL